MYINPIKNNFDKGPEGWCSYDYHASMVADGSNIFILATWAAHGGVDNGSFIWTDHRRWSADTPERPCPSCRCCTTAVGSALTRSICASPQLQST